MPLPPSARKKYYSKQRRTFTIKGMKPEQYNQKHKGQRGFVIGGGPSIRDLLGKGFDFSLLQNEITVGVNKSYKLFTPTYLVFGDAYFWRKFKKEIKDLKCKKLAPMNILGGSGVVRSLSDMIPIKRTVGVRDDLPTSFSNPICFLNNSGVAALRISFLLGLNPIYLVGMDIGPNNKGETHFHDDYQSDPQRITKPQRYEQFFNSFKETIGKIQNKGVDIFSCSQTSKLNKFVQYVDLFSLFPHD